MDPVTFNATMELCGAICSVIGVLILMMMKDTKNKNSYIELLLLLNCAAILFFDSVSFMTRNNEGWFFYFAARTSSFLVFFCDFLYIFLFMTFIWKLVKKEDEKMLFRVYFVYAFSIVGILYLIVGQFFGLVFTYNEANAYSRGKGWIVTQIIVALSIIVASSVFFQYRKRIQKVLFYTMCGYYVCLVVGTVGALFLPQIAVQNMTTVIATICILIVEANNYREKLNEYKKKEFESLKDIDRAYKDLSSYQDHINKTLQGASTGLWSLEVVLGENPRLICDDNMMEILGFSKDVSPEDCYIEFNKRLVKEDLKKFGEYNRQLVEEGKGEVIYRWNHPSLGETYMR